MTRRRMPRPLQFVVLALAALVLSACAGLPTSGPVFAGLKPGAVAPPDFSFIPLKPQDGATPEQIVQGFIDAGTGPDGNWGVAQLYLAPSFRSQWKPNEGTTIDDRSHRTYTKSADDKVTLTITQRATVDATGAYRASDGGRSTLAPFSLAKVDGQWRITKAPNGIVIGADQFSSVYDQYAVMYFDPTWHYLVPDVRWYPSYNAATRIAQNLIDGKPTPWLADSVTSAFPDSISLNVPSVPLSASGVARVELSGPVYSLEPQTLDRMQTQLRASLAGAGVSDVSMTYGGAQVSAGTVATTATRIDSRALVDTEKGFGFLSPGDQVETVAHVSDALKAVQPVGIELSADYAAAAVRTASGAVARVTTEVAALDQRAGLIDPAIDAAGMIWSVPAADPSALEAFGADGKRHAVNSGAWSNASSIRAMAVSRDGTRIAALLDVGGQDVVQVAGIVRGAGGVPERLGDAVQLSALPGRGIDLTWVDDSTVAAVARSGGADDATAVIRQIVGGPSTVTAAPADITTIAGTVGTTVRLRGADRTLYAQRGSNWEQAGTGIRVLATVQGMPPQAQTSG
ncbi:LpqB family beta-propeller domain-containing protein [Microbacterium sp.]|uniref:LpqB family beta-propeller domain-containing protein n=1 Tax=Microbacterium sp. TaxID=51671 RepID=UPI003A90AFB9